MRFRVLACDYDGTIATEGVAAPATVRALAEVRRSGRRLLLITGRTRLQLEAVFGEWTLFDRIVLENGAVLVDPSTGDERLLCEPLSSRLVGALALRGVEPLAMGRAVCATAIRHLDAVREAVLASRVPLDIVVNRGGVVILPAGVSKSSGLRAALLEVGEPATACVAIGDAENDLPMLAAAGCGVAVADALDELKAMADLVMSRPDGAGTAELAGRLVADDLTGEPAGIGGAGATRR